MAGFDFDFRYDVRLSPLLDACLPAAMSRARKLDLRWRNERLDELTLRCVIDGNGRRMALLAHALERDLPVVAEGVTKGGFPPAMRRRLGLGFADLYIRGLDSRTEHRMTWRGVTATRYYFSPYDLSDTEHPMLAARMRITEGVILDWWFKRTDGTVLLEELHTAAELLLEDLVNRRARRLSFAELVTAAEEAGLLDWPTFPESIAPAIQPTALLLELKDLRKDARHRGSRAFEDWLDASWESVTLVLERLVRRIEPAP